MRARRLFAVVLSFAAALAVFAATRDDERAAAGPPRVGGSPPPGRAPADTDARIAALQAAVRAAAPTRQAALAAAYLQKVRETGDPSYYARADRLLAQRARARRPPTRACSSRRPRWPPRATTSAPRWSSRGRARAAAPDTARAAAVLVDALVELGRYGAAERTLQRSSTSSRTSPPTRACPTSASCTATSPGPSPRCDRAIAAGGPARENVAVRAEPARRSRAGPRPARRGAARAYDAALAACRATRRAAAGRGAPGRRRRATCAAAIAPLAPRRRPACRCPST